MPETLKSEIGDGVFHIVLNRPDEMNTITPQFRDELSAALDEAEGNDDARVVLLSAQGRAFSAGYGLDWAIDSDQGQPRVWDSVADLMMLSKYSDTFCAVVAFT